MEASRFIQEISEETLELNLKQYIGKKVEIIVLPVEEETNTEIDILWLEESSKRLTSFRQGKSKSSSVKNFLKELKNKI